MSNAELMPLEKTPAVAPHSSVTTPADLLAMAVSQGADLDKLERLMALQERYESNEARKAFNVAFAEFKAEAVKVIKGTEIKDGPLKGKHHANLHDVVIATAAPLAKHGLTAAWKLTRDEPAMMEVTCVLKHAAGHSESVSMSAAPDTGPGRNAIQARGSAKTYLERYTLMAILGLAASDQDDDGGHGDVTDDKAGDWIKVANDLQTPQDYDVQKKRLLADYGNKPEKLPPKVRTAFNAAKARVMPKD